MNVLIYEKISNWYFKYKDIDIWKINTLIYGITNNWHLEYKYVDRGKDRLLRGGKKDYWEAERKNIDIPSIPEISILDILGTPGISTGYQ